MLEIAFSVVLPVFLLIAVGMLLGRTIQPDLRTINRTALYGAVPALVFASLTQAELVPSQLGVLIGGWLAIIAVVAGISYLTTRLLLGRFVTPKARSGFVATSIFSNSANMMLPITLFALGQEGLERALILFVLSSMILFSLGPLVFSGQGAGLKSTLAAVVRLPVLWAALLGISVNLSGLTLPTGLMRGVEILGDAAIPLVLLALGLQMQRSGNAAPTAVNMFATGFKLLVVPLVAFLVALLIGARGLDLAVLTLLAAMPPAVNTFMLALEFGGDAEEVARTVALATFSSLFTLTAVVWLLRWGVV
jgi:predicted permease